MRYHRLCIDPLRLVNFGPPSSAPRTVARRILGFVWFLACPALALAADPAPDTPAPDTPGGSVAAGRLVLVQRVVAQDQGDWQVDYAFRNAGAEPLALQPRDVRVRVEGWLSNSRIAVHANPKQARSAVDGQFASAAYAELIPSLEEHKRCRERVSVVLSTGPSPALPALTPPLGSFGATATPNRGAPVPLVPVTVGPGDLVRVRLRLEHQHTLHGDYDPLLGRRELELCLGATTFRDTLPLDREQYRAQPKATWPEPPDDRKDARYFVTGPDSLHLDADLPGANYYRFPERKVRYSTRMRLKFWYRIAPGTEGELHARVAQYRESPDSWKVLADGGSDAHLATANGTWVRFERIIRTEAEATTLALDFRISPCDVGEAWIDDVTLEPADGPAGGP